MRDPYKCSSYRVYRLHHAYKCNSYRYTVAVVTNPVNGVTTLIPFDVSDALIAETSEAERGVAGVGNAEQRGILFMGSSINSYKYPRYSLKTFVVERKI